MITKTLKILKFLIIIFIVIGVILRGVNIDKKIYWGDETFTSLRVSGYTVEEVNQELVNNQLLTKQDIKKYQQINSQKNLSGTIDGLAKEEPQFPPVYFALTRFWSEIFGNSIAITRSFSAAISLLIFPLIYWLCLELFNSSLIGWIAMLIVAVSPFHVLYAQEARPYSLWTVTVLLSSASFLRALRLKNRVAWSLYTLTLILGLYSYLMNILLIITNGIYLFIIERFKLTKNFQYFLLSSLMAILSFVPWIILFITNLNSFQKTSNWALENTSLSVLIQEWFRNISYSFMDFWYYFTYNPNSVFNLNYGNYLIPTILFLIVYSFYFLIRNADVRIWLYIVILMAVNASVFVVPDLIIGGYRSIMARYFVPCYLGIQLSVAYLFAAKIVSNHSKNNTNLWKFLLSALILGGIISCTVSSQAETWWNKRTTSYDHVLIAKFMNQRPNSLLIMKSHFGTIASLSSRIDANITYQVITDNNGMKIAEAFQEQYLLTSPDFSVDKLQKQQKFSAKRVYQGRKQSLWQIF